MRKNERLLPATTWLNLGMILAEEARHQRVHMATLHSYEVQTKLICGDKHSFLQSKFLLEWIMRELSEVL